MARELGRFFKVYVGDGASPEVFTAIAGQEGLDRNAATNLIDQSNKSDNPYAVQAPGRTTLTVSISGKRIIPDAAGLERVYSQFKAQAATNFRVVNEEPSPDLTVLEGSFYISSFSQGDADEDNATYSFDLTVASAPTTDTLD